MRGLGGALFENGRWWVARAGLILSNPTCCASDYGRFARYTRCERGRQFRARRRARIKGGAANRNFRQFRRAAVSQHRFLCSLGFSQGSLKSAALSSKNKKKKGRGNVDNDIF